MANALDGSKVYIDPTSSLYSEGVLGYNNNKAYLDTNTLGWMDQTWFVNGISYWSDRMFVDSFGETILNSYNTGIDHEMLGVGNAKHGWVEHESFGLIYLVPDVYLIYLTFYWVSRYNDRELSVNSQYYAENNQLEYLGFTGTDYDFLRSSRGLWVWLGESNGFAGGYNGIKSWVFFNRESICGGSGGNNSSQLSNTGISSHINNQGLMGIGSFWINGTVEVQDSIVYGVNTNFTQDFDEVRLIYISQPNNQVSVHRVSYIVSNTQCIISPGAGLYSNGNPVIWSNRQVGKEGLVYFLSNGNKFYAKNHTSSWSQINENYRSGLDPSPLPGYNI